jgi:hypothetical protein
MPRFSGYRGGGCRKCRAGQVIVPRVRMLTIVRMSQDTRLAISIRRGSVRLLDGKGNVALNEA